MSVLILGSVLLLEESVIIKSVDCTEVWKRILSFEAAIDLLRFHSLPWKHFSGRQGGLVVSALDSGSRGPGSSPGRVIVLCSWARHFTLTVPLSTQ